MPDVGDSSRDLDGGGDTAGDELAQLQSALEVVATTDPQYALCVLDAGVFTAAPWSRDPLDSDFDDGSRSSSSSSASGSGSHGESPESWRREERRRRAEDQRLAAALLGVDPANVTLGLCMYRTCRVEHLGVSAACCEAAARVRECPRRTTTSPGLARANAVLDRALGLRETCTRTESATNARLGAALALLVLGILAFGGLARRFHRRNERRGIIDIGETAGTNASSRLERAYVQWRQVMNLVWKNYRLKRHRPVAMIIEFLLPLFLTSGLAFLANVDTLLDSSYEGYDPYSYLYGSSSSSSSSSPTTMKTPAARFVCSDVRFGRQEDLGVPTGGREAFYTSGQTVVSLFMLLVFIKYVSRTTALMVLDKETRVREIMRIMGLTDWTLMVSWLVSTSAISLPLSLALAVELKYTRIFPNTPLMTLTVVFYAFNLSITAFAYFLTPLFNKSRTAAIASVLVWIILYFPFILVQVKPNATKYVAALSPPTAFALAVDDILRHARLGAGITYELRVAKTPITTPSALAMTGMLLLDAILLFALGWYLDQVIPQQFGVPKPWHFLFQRSYWAAHEPSRSSVTAGSKRDDGRSSYLPVSTPAHVTAPSVATNGAVIEAVSAQLAAQERNGTCLQIRSLHKVFESEDAEPCVAVNNLHLNLYAGQITALLGHNGAGKTTTISMLTGLIPPTSGDATLFGRSIKHDFDELRQIMGICPQHDVLFPDLTVEEHLRFFGTMKNVPDDELLGHMDQMIQDVGLTEKRHVLVKNLSGGQKRKLSVAIAFLGGSKLVFLDEPTSGMDPYSRRFTWNLLQQNRDGRVIVLTTHFMDEADILGDRIAIMADGELRCAGTSLFLKNRYGAGYNLTMITSPNCEMPSVLALLESVVPDVACLSHHGSEMVFQLPSTSAAAFPEMLQTLDREMASLGVTHYGMSVTTLEEVFLRIANDRAGDARAGLHREAPAAKAVVAREFASFGAQFGALFKKRVRISRRDRKSLLNAVIIPMILLIILAAIPEIQVSTFLSGIATKAPPASTAGTCDFALPAGERSDWRSEETSTSCRQDFAFCDLGIFDCSVDACCDMKNPVSPYFPCNNCNDPYPYSTCENPVCLTKTNMRTQVTLNSFIQATLVMLAFVFIPAAIVAFVVREKDPIQDAKSLQLICGAKSTAYWLANWAHDLLSSLVSVVLTAIVVPVASRTINRVDGDVAALIALVMSHVLAVIPMAYVVAYRYEKHSSAQTVLLVFGLVTGGVVGIFSFFCRVVDVELTSGPKPLTLPNLDRSYLRWIFMLSPSYSLQNGMYELLMHRLSRQSLVAGDNARVDPPSFFGLRPWLGQEPCVECWDANVPGCCVRSPFDWDVAGAPIAYLLLEAMAFAVIIYIVERRGSVWKAQDPSQAPCTGESILHETVEDDDVAAERRKVETSEPTGNDDSIFIQRLRQEYKGGKVALENLSLSIPKGECFGYLGINGAGKSTTLRILTGQSAPTAGFVSLSGYDLARFRDNARAIIGYCPQFDSLHDLLTVEEQLELYAHLKGIPSHLVGTAVEEKIAEVGLGEYRTRLTKGLSGGNKRKVSTAIALMGSPQIIFLDEPSTGVDPSARRKMWDVIAAVCAEKTSCVVLTTHSMEECEALCTRVGILVSGRLKCLGSVEHLKHKFGKGYTVEVKLQAADEMTEAAVATLRARIEAAMGGDELISATNVEALCAELGDEIRGTLIASGVGSGAMMATVLEANDHIPQSTFIEWWLSEDLGEELRDFFAERLPGSHLVEQQGDHFRFQVPKEGLRPWAIFRLLEEAKAALHVSEYNVSDTSLEHIFNNMAAEQEEEQLDGGQVQRSASARRGRASRLRRRGTRQTSVPILEANPSS